jgi:CubicO group peptidase (beta-lactamase class C family)
MPKLNADWHRRHRMPSRATMEERIAWHVAHRRACACRPVPATVVAAMRARGLNLDAAPASVKRAKTAVRRAGALFLAMCLAQTWPVHGQMAAPVAPAASAAAAGLSAAFPEIRRIAEAFVERNHVPGAAVGVIANGELVFATGIGVRDRSTNAPATPDSIFRIASMTKSFTAASILKLRDEGRLSLDDLAERYVPELKTLSYPTKDSPRITIRHLLSHSEGFPEDNPWGDRQLARPDAVISEWMRTGIPFSTAPGTAYEYSNYGFAILGQIVARVSGQPYADYLQTNILDPLGMTSTRLEVSAVPADRIAKGYRWIDQRWEDEPLLPHGSFGSMGGLWTSTGDLAKWVAFLLDGFPPRDDDERGPIRRASAREMQQVWRPTRGTATRAAVDAALVLNAGGYGYGLRIAQSCAFGHLVAHGGGLPGYGSQMQWLPEYGVGLIAMGNVTYAGWGGAFAEMWAALQKSGALTPRAALPSAALRERQREISALIARPSEGGASDAQRWDQAATRIAADNLFLDESAASRRARLEQLTALHGACRPSDRITAENALRGSWRMPCDRGWLDVSITLAPTMPPTVQFWSIKSVLPPSAVLTSAASAVAGLVSEWDDARAGTLVTSVVDLPRLRRQANLVRAQFGACRAGEHVDGDGSSRATVQFTCDGGAVMSSITIDPASGRVTLVALSPVTEAACSAW